MKEYTLFVWLLCGLLDIWKVQTQIEKYTCGNLIRDSSSGTIASPNKGPDDTYEPNQRCRWTLVAQEHMMIQLQVLEMDIEEHEECLNDYLAIYDGNDIIGKGYYCGSEAPSVVTFNSRVSYVDFVSNENINRKGFKAKYEQIKDSDCGNVLTLRAGSILAVSVANWWYQSNVVCIWMIEKEPSAEHLQVLIVDMNIRLSNHCTDGYLMIRGNALSPTRYCGSTPPPLFTSTSKYTFILFQSDVNHSSSHFSAVYTNSDKDFQCGGIMTNNSGVISSKDSNNDTLYDINLECVWVIVAPPTYAIELAFKYIDIEWHKNCEWDHIRVFDGLNSYPFDGLIGWYCGKDIPEPVLSKSNILYVEFVSDQNSVFTGFEIIYRHIKDINSTRSFSTSTIQSYATDRLNNTKGNGTSGCGKFWWSSPLMCLIQLITLWSCR